MCIFRLFIEEVKPDNDNLGKIIFLVRWRLSSLLLPQSMISKPFIHSKLAPSLSLSPQMLNLTLIFVIKKAKLKRDNCVASNLRTTSSLNFTAIQQP